MNRSGFMLGIALMISASAMAAPQTFTSKASKGSLDEFSRITLTRDCTDLKNEPFITCKRQEIVVKDKTGKVIGKFPENELPKLPNGIYKVNLANVLVVDEDEGGGNSNRYFYFRFIPHDSAEIDVSANGQMTPKYYEVVTDALLRPIQGMHLSANGAAATWLDVKRKLSDKKFKAHEIDAALHVGDYLIVMSDN